MIMSLLLPPKKKKLICYDCFLKKISDYSFIASLRIDNSYTLIHLQSTSELFKIKIAYIHNMPKPFPKIYEVSSEPRKSTKKLQKYKMLKKF